jgi:hypothetical protein
MTTTIIIIGGTIIESDNAPQNFRDSPPFDLLRISNDIRKPDALNADDPLKIDEAVLIPVRILEALHEVGAVGVAHEEGADGAAVVQQDVDAEGVRRALHDCVRVLAEAGGGGVGEVGLCPGLCVDGDVQEHLALCAGAGILKRDDGEFRDDSESQDPARVLADAEVLDFVCGGFEEVCAGEEAAGGEGVAACCCGGGGEGDAVDEVGVGGVFEVFCAVGELAAGGVCEELLGVVGEGFLGVVCLS